jgi:hypothetical protein
MFSGSAEKNHEQFNHYILPTELESCPGLTNK